ncbi:unnamed protein product [Brassica napus]|uniref:Uncharacterized protein n=2 Tax=Brassica TaxID=3705 RepID=A0A0D3BAM1_BRAOL|nr:PREDICTED: uncharacterized protein LOC106333995 [Brassica oleracea var. oleracea]CAF1703953.1 unnamed protein product [Brassica napus]
MQKIAMSRKEVIVCRGIWYVMALLSLFGLSISLNLLWPPGGKSPALSRFLRDGAVSATTFYAVTLLRYLLFTDTPSSNCYKDFTTDKERIPQVVFAEFSILALFCSPYLLVDHPDHDVWLYMSLFTISLFTGGIGLIQLSDKFRMDMKHAYITLLCGWLCWLFGSYVFIYLPSMAVAMIPIGVYWMFALSILLYNFCSEEFSINSSDSPLPT